MLAGICKSMDYTQESSRKKQQGNDRSKWIVHSNPNIKCFTKREVEIMANNYRTIIGRGAFGEVYRGVLDKSVVAVKRLVYNVRENFHQELAVHREFNHKNVVRLIGYCVEENALVMVTEYIPNGNLSGVLHSDNNIPISLETRIRIAIDCAEALAYMHSYMYTQVIHGDIKPANILLDDSLDGSLKAKISDFGISRLVNDPDRTLFTAHVVGSIGYMDPLFARDGRLTAKSDVYSFGVVLVELITRKRATSVGEANVVDVFANARANGFRGVREIFDAEIKSQNNMKILERVAKLASECLLMERGRRPDMIHVVERLRTFGKASHQGQQRVDLFPWSRKNKSMPPALVKTSSPSDLCRRFSHEEMKAVTRNFDKSLLVNPAIFGASIYCGWIDGGATKVAIKRSRNRHGGDHEFRSVIETRSKLRHHHVVPLIGYCDENDEEMILVYDFMALGTLHYHLYENKEQRLTWRQRLEICIGAARGLHYLHRGTKMGIIHGNLNTETIFLDENRVAKITDGGLSDIASNYWVLSLNFLAAKPYGLTEESDVYAFGALLFEVLSGTVGRIIPKIYMLKWALHFKEEGRLHVFSDHTLNGEINLHSLNNFVEIAAKCVADKEIDRPSMEDVLSDLECALQLQLQVDVSAGASGSGS